MSSEQDNNLARLFRAIDDLDNQLPEDHSSFLERLPSLIEAEMAGEDVAEQYSDLLAHLDICLSCETQHAILLDLALADERDPSPQAVSNRPLRLPRPVAIQQLVRKIAEALIQKSDQVRNLPMVLQTFFELALESPQPLSFDNTPALVMGLGNESPEILAPIMAAYYAIQAVLKQYPAAEIEAMDNDRLERILQQAALEQARLYGLSGAAANTFVNTLVREFTVKNFRFGF